MNEIKTGGPAAENLTVRDHFAALAMPIAASVFHAGIGSEDNYFTRLNIARLAYAIADAMLKVRGGK